LYKTELQRNGDYREKHNLYHITDTIWGYFETSGSKRKKTMSWDEKKFIIREHRQNYINKKRLLNKMENYSKWVKVNTEMQLLKMKWNMLKWDLANTNGRKIQQ
jgi:hypothetical protein